MFLIILTKNVAKMFFIKQFNKKNAAKMFFIKQFNKKKCCENVFY
jgi:hypothetical protein